MKKGNHNPRLGKMLLWLLATALIGGSPIFAEHVPDGPSEPVTSRRFAPGEPSRISFYCRQPGTSAPYSVNVVDFKVANVSRAGFTGTRTVASLRCSQRFTPPVGPKTEGARTFLKCSEPGSADMGYVVELKSVGVAGLPKATLSKIGIATTTHIAELNCMYPATAARSQAGMPPSGGND